MTNDKTVTMSLELAERLDCGRNLKVALDSLNELRAALAAPVVERQPDAELLVEFFEHGPMATIKWLTPSSFEPGATKVYTATPELAELQATIARLTEQKERLTANLKIRDRELEVAAEYHSDLQVELGRLKGGQGEPVAIDDNVEFEKWWMSTPILRKQKIQIAQEAWFARAKLASQPAPVSVVLPLREMFHGEMDNPEIDFNKGWNACLDKVKELNQ